MSTSEQNVVNQLVLACQDFYLNFYNLESSQPNALDFVLQNENGEHDAVFENGSMGSLWVHPTKEECSIKLGFHSRLKDAMTCSPLEDLNNTNLAASLVVFEEVSHFVYVVDSLHHDRDLNHFDLELQAEIDKILFTSWLLFNQTGDAHWNPLVREAFDRVVMHQASKVVLYSDVHNVAARFWFRWIETLGTRWHPFECDQSRTNFSKIYHRSNVSKIRAMNLIYNNSKIAA